MSENSLTNQFESWGRFPKAQHYYQRVDWRDVALDLNGQAHSLLPYGQGRSYGDCCLNKGGALLVTQGLNRFISFEPDTGLLRCEAGVTLAEILRLVVPQGWFLPVTPGTKFVSVGGAIANDIHGKNHHRVGTFGNFVRRFELLRSAGQRLLCSPTENSDWFAATIGGLGLTGLIQWAEIQLKPINNAFIEVESIRTSGLDEFFQLALESDQDFEYTVSWVDCLARGRALGRGIFLRGNHAPAQAELPSIPKERKLAVPLDAPELLLNGLSVRAFNWLYYHKQLKQRVTQLVHYDPFFYPLDAVLHWNRLYGRRGFFQYQCVVPYGGSDAAIREILEMIAASGIASFLAVLKIFGSATSPGLLSFPRPGVTLALDFPNRGEKLFELFNRLDRVVQTSGGALYPAKDAVMSAESYQQFYPRWRELSAFIDPRFSSSFWRRVTGQKALINE